MCFKKSSPKLNEGKEEDHCLAEGSLCLCVSVTYCSEGKGAIACKMLMAVTSAEND